jgi:aspartyl-tRNA(Asn)/glutamyl-tRNA(Gln) amidotransferase subunit A
VDEVVYLSACELLKGYRQRELTPVEVVAATLDQIERLNPVVNAYITVTADLAKRAARDAEKAWAGGEADRPLLGVPVSLKDLTPTRGIRTTRGSLLYKDWIPDFDAPIVERIDAAGGVLLGKTNTPEFGWKGDSGNRLVGPTHNPWKHGLTAGGSSGGAAAAVASGMGPLAQGTDGAGSIRIPAAFCGVFGLKPSFGLVPYYPASAVDSLAHIGPITRTVGDAALFLGVLAGPDARDRNSLNATHLDYLSAMKGGVKGLHIAWSPTLGYATVEPEIEQLTASAALVFGELGATVEEADPALDDPFPIIDTLWCTAQAAAHLDDLPAVRDQLDPGRLKLIEKGMRMSGPAVAAANLKRGEFCERLRRFMQGYDLLLTPTLPITAFTAGADRPDSIPSEALSWTPFTYPFNLTGQPAATVPCGSARNGLPVGLQIVGRWRDDLTVLRAAAAFEAARPWAHLRPPVA